MTKTALSPAARWWINRSGFAVILLGAVGVIVATLAPCRLHIGPMQISFRGVRNPMLGILIGYGMWRSTYDGFGRWLKGRTDRIGSASGAFGRQIGHWYFAVVELWHAWGWRQRTMIGLVIVQSVFALRTWQSYPSTLEYERIAHANMVRLASFGPPGGELSLLEHFCREVCAETPPDARILLHGATPLMRVAYEVYPRRVFILPQEMTALAESWHVQPQLRDLRPDPHEPYWHQFLPHNTVDAATFVREHGINYVATFDEYNLSQCRVERAP